jgi:hypothetical protein
MITDKKTLDEVFRLRSTFQNEYSRKLAIAEFPEAVQKIINSGEKLTPGHCTPEVIEELYLSRLAVIQPRFTLDSDCASVIRLIADRITSGVTSKRGLMLLGGIGSGKTLLMRGMVDVFWCFNIEVRLLPTYVLTENYGRDGMNAFGRVQYSGHEVYPGSTTIILDDLGAESIATHYGQPTNVVAEVLLRRYDNRALTFGTSNLDQRTIRKFYGERVWSRMKEMFNFIELKGDDRRK